MLIRIVLIKIILLLSVVIYVKIQEPQPVSIHLVKPNSSPVPILQAASLLNEVNQKNKKIVSLVSDIRIRTWENGRKFKLTGKIFYEKPQSFRMEVASFLGKELDLGSNQNEFWYWSKRDKSPAVYWANHNNFHKTRLKTPFNPLYMRASLGFDLVSDHDSHITENETQIIVTTKHQDSLGRSVFYSVLINKDRKQIDGFTITDVQGTHLVACEIRKRDGELPLEILYAWHEENYVMLLEFRSHAVNKNIEKNLFLLPNYAPRINMAD